MSSSELQKERLRKGKEALPATQPCEQESCFSTGGWEFRRSYCDVKSSLEFLDKYGFEPPLYRCEFELGVHHLDSGIKFLFNVNDALLMFNREKEKYSTKQKSYKRPDLPTYNSPLRYDSAYYGYDSAYVGKVLLEEPGEDPKNCSSMVWENIDWNTLGRQVVWVDEHFRLCERPTQYFDDAIGPRRPTGRILKQEEKEEEIKGLSKGLVDPLVNFRECLYTNFGQINGSSYCIFELVVLDCGWFLSLFQFFNKKGAKRTREMTMHCNFKQNIIYREIIESQSKDFYNMLSKFKVHRGALTNLESKMCVYYQEAKQLKIQEACMGGCTGCDVGRYRSYAVDELTQTSIEAVDFPDDQIKLLFTNCGEQLELVEEKTKARIQIIPLFGHPRNPKMSTPQPRTGYIYGSEHNVKYAKNILAKLFTGVQFRTINKSMKLMRSQTVAVMQPKPMRLKARGSTTELMGRSLRYR